MLFNNLRLAFRHLSRQKLNTALHIVGLSIGMSICLLIGLLLRYEWSFDRYHHKADRIYRITSQYRDASHNVHGSSTPVPLAESLRSGVAGIENVTLAHPFSTAQIGIAPGKQFIQKNMLAVDPEILDIFDIEVVAGNGHDALLKPYHSLLTETTAKKFFGNEDPLGKTFQFNRDYNIIVGGVVKDQPSNTSLPFSILLSFVDNRGFLGVDPNNWLMTQGNSTFVLLPGRPGIKHFEAQLKSIADKNINADPNLPRGIRGDFHLQPLKSIHFEPKYGVLHTCLHSRRTFYCIGPGMPARYEYIAGEIHRPVTATLIVQLPKFYNEASIRLEANSNIPQAIASIQTAWKRIYPDQVFEVHFLDQSIDDFYKSETRLYTLFRIFATLAMCISCLGLWGLVTLAAQQRTKEIGIRKVLGASVNAIVMLLSKDFLSMVVIALAVAAPLVYYFMERWLETFAYRIDIGWAVFVFAGMVSIVIALMTVSVQTLKAAFANPVDSLRNE